MEHIKLVCFSDKCLILNPDDKATQNFIYGLKMQFHCEVIQSCQKQRWTKKIAGECSRARGITSAQHGILDEAPLSEKCSGEFKIQNLQVKMKLNYISCKIVAIKEK